MAKPRPCNRFQNHVGIEMLPASAFSWGPGTTKHRRRRAVCDDCRAKEAAEKAAARAAWRSTFEDPDTGVMMRRCSTCRTVKVLDEEFYVEHRNDDGSIKGRAYICRSCSVVRTNAIRRERLRDPATAGLARAQSREWQRQWRERNREAYRRSQRAYAERIKADPVRYARQLENERIAYRLRKERRGLGPAQNQRVRKPAPEPKLPALPAEPLLRAVEEHLHQTGGVLSLAELGVNERSVRRWREDLEAGRTPRVQFRAADKTLLAIGRNVWDVWPEDRYPDVHERLRKALGEET